MLFPSLPVYDIAEPGLPLPWCAGRIRNSRSWRSGSPQGRSSGRPASNRWSDGRTPRLAQSWTKPVTGRTTQGMWSFRRTVRGLSIPSSPR